METSYRKMIASNLHHACADFSANIRIVIVFVMQLKRLRFRLQTGVPSEKWRASLRGALIRSFKNELRRKKEFASIVEVNWKLLNWSASWRNVGNTAKDGSDSGASGSAVRGTRLGQTVGQAASFQSRHRWSRHCSHPSHSPARIHFSPGL